MQTFQRVPTSPAVQEGRLSITGHGGPVRAVVDAMAADLPVKHGQLWHHAL